MSDNRLLFENASVLAGALRSGVRPRIPFDEVVCAFLDALSKNLLRDSTSRAFSDVLSFAYWCRASNLEAKRCKFQETNPGLRLGRGLAFHIAPSNVPVNFAFSFAFSLLAGNANIVRVPSKKFPQVEAICHVLERTLSDFPEIAAENVFVRYSPESDTTLRCSEIADVRIVWGGDRTVRTIRSMPSKPRCVDIAFSDRYSFAVLDGSSILKLNSEGLVDLAKGFFNDTYLMDQNACSSPMFIGWKNDSPKAREVFWSAVRSYVNAHYEMQPALAMDKYVHLCEDVLEGRLSRPLSGFDGSLVQVDVSELLANKVDTFNICDLRGKAGYFYEASISSLEDILPFLDERVQTLTYFGEEGMGAELTKQIICSRTQGIDRVVPIGLAMDIDFIWDGFDLTNVLSRVVDISYGRR